MTARDRAPTLAGNPAALPPGGALGSSSGLSALDVSQYVQTLGKQARLASAQMARADAAIKNKALRRLAQLLRSNVQALQSDNAKDLKRATAAGLAAAIPAVLFYNYLSGRVKLFASEMDDFAMEFLNISERNFT